MKHRTAIAALLIVAVFAAGLCLVVLHSRSALESRRAGAPPGKPAESTAPREPAVQVAPAAPAAEPRLPDVPGNTPELRPEQVTAHPAPGPGAMLPPPPDPVARARGFVARLSRPGDADLRESVRAAIRTGAAGDHQTRLRAVQALPPASELAPEELQALYWFLASNEPELHGSTSENAIKNDILTHLIKGGSPVPADLLDLLLGVFYDTTQDRTWRDYIVQHFRFYVQQRWPDVRAASLPGDADLTALSDAYGAATRETGTGLAGTALIGLEFLSREYPAFERAKILETAEALARSADAKETVRATALQVCSLARIPAVLPLALDIVRGTGAGVPLRMAAVAMVGDLGGTGDVPILESLLAQGDTRLHTAAATAIDRIRRREAL